MIGINSESPPLTLSPRFGVNNRYGTFWSVGGAWNVDEEAFLHDSKIFSALKLRASYGVNGNAGIGRTTTLRAGSWVKVTKLN